MSEFFRKPIVKILMLKGEKGEKGKTGTGTPTGGKTGQYLQKKSDVDYDYRWSDITTVQWDNVSGKTNATKSSAGLMSADDKTALDMINDGKNKKYINDCSFIDDFNDIHSINNTSVVIGWSKANASNFPIGIDGNACLAIQGGEDNYMVQMAIGFGSKKIAIRNKYGVPNWKDWEYIEPKNSIIKSFTLSESSWSSGNYTISDSLITDSSNQEIIPAIGITADQLKALQKANIVDAGQSAGSLTLKSLGTVPTIDIPIRVIFRGTI